MKRKRTKRMNRASFTFHCIHFSFSSHLIIWSEYKGRLGDSSWRSPWRPGGRSWSVTSKAGMANGRRRRQGAQSSGAQRQNFCSWVEAAVLILERLRLDQEAEDRRRPDLASTGHPFCSKQDNISKLKPRPCIVFTSEAGPQQGRTGGKASQTGGRASSSCFSFGSEPRRKSESRCAG